MAPRGNKKTSINNHRGVEQLVARRAHNPKVTGSSPVPATTKFIPPAGSGWRLFIFSLAFWQCNDIIYPNYGNKDVIL
jgi:hypothetical protein